MKSSQNLLQKPPSDWLKGTVERVTFHSEETGFCVLRVQIKGQSTLQTVIGNAASIQAGEFIECGGNWINDRQHGLQFQAHHLKIIAPTTLEGMEKYLASGMVKGIGPGYAKRLIAAFKEKVFEVIEHEPEKLNQVAGIGAKRQQLIIVAWAQQRVIRDIMVFLHAHGVGTSRAVRIFKKYGNEAIEKVKSNPYLLAQDIHGMGFKTADALAQRLGIAKDSILRCRAGVTYCLQEMTSQGHCGASKESLEQKAKATLEVEPHLILQAIEDEKHSERIIEILIDQIPYCFLKSLYLAEKGIAQQCQRLQQGTLPWACIDIAKAIKTVHNATQLTLSESQSKAVHLALQSKITIITGGPGVGKTTLVNSIIKIIRLQNVRVVLTAPTGRAAKRLSETTGLEAKTIHRLLELNPTSYQFKYTQDNPLALDLLVIDESSMVDVVLMYQLLKAVPSSAALLIVGDVDQLPSVGPGMVLKDLIDSQTLPTVFLTEIFRQAKTSQIITNAHRINAGKMPIGGEKNDLAPSDFFIIPCENPDQIKEKIISVVCKHIPQKFKLDPIRDIQVLTPTRRGALGTASLNLDLQKKLNPQSETIQKYGNVFGVGDKVIQTVNNYDKEVFNGDIGTIIELEKEEDTLWVEFDERRVEYAFSELDEIQLAYATTIHKSQGSEYPAVVIPITMQHFTLLERNLLYTGVTRGKKLVVIIGQTKAIAMTTKRLQAQMRVTYLKQLLQTRD